MSEFISRKQLEISGSDATYELRSELKRLGCEWDAAAKAWIAPTLEVKELIYEMLEEYEIKKPLYGRAGWQTRGMDVESVDAFLNETPAVPTPLAKSIAYTPTKTDAEHICGSENVLRYWRDEISDVAAEILASGELNWNAIYERLEDAGWRNRSVSIVREIVEHYRQHPPIPAIDEVLTMPAVLGVDAVDPEEIDGTISVFVDADKNPISFKIQFPYSEEMVQRVKGFSGRKWRAESKCWEVPLDSKGWGFPSPTVFQAFPYFKRSPRAAQLESENN